jgi:RND family efflux transporter MFP subunit
MKKQRTWIFVCAVFLLVAGGGYAAWARRVARGEESPEPTLQAVAVTRGDILVTVAGSGELVPAAELELAFRTGGVLDEVLVETGDRVAEGDVLARLDTGDLERALDEAEMDLQFARLDLADVQDGPGDTELADAQAALRDARVELTLAEDADERAANSNLNAVAETRRKEFEWWTGYYQGQKEKYEQGRLSRADHDWAMAAMIAAEGRWQEAVNQALAEEIQAGSRVTQARNGVTQAWDRLQLLQSEPLTDTLVRATLDVDEALLARERARLDLEAAQLYAPFGGVVLEVAAAEGEQVGTGAPILTLADLGDGLVHFWVEESDLYGIAVGNAVEVVFEARPDETFSGEIVRVAPLLAMVGGTPAVEAWATLGTAAGEVGLLSGMTAEVEVIAAEARNALLVPVEALRETSPGETEVLVVGPDGEMERRPVVVGVRGAVYAQVIDGLGAEEVVIVGEVE